MRLKLARTIIMIIDLAGIIMLFRVGRKYHDDKNWQEIS